MSTSILQKFSTHLRQVLKNSIKTAWEMRHEQITPFHLLYNLVSQKGAVGAEILTKAGLRKEKIITRLVDFGKKKQETYYLPALDDASQKIIVKAALLAAKNQHRYIGTEHLLLALVEPETSPIYNFLLTEKIDLKTLTQTAANVLSSANRFPEMSALFNLPAMDKEKEAIVKTIGPAKRKTKKNPALDFFTLDLTNPRELKKLDPIVGRREEINRLIQILCRRSKNNPVLLGDPGVGKTAIVEGLAQKIASGEAPDALQGKKIRRLDLGLLVAGTIYRGEFEGRLKQVLDEARDNPDIILFIDELHTIVGAGAAGGSLDAANLLKPALARGELRCIGATTFEEFKKHIESDPALERRFQPVIVNEPSREETLAILKGLRENYEKYHLIKISDAALAAAADLAERYRQDKFFPDKAIDLLDEAAAAKKLTAKASGPLRQLKALEKEQVSVREAKEEAALAEDFEKALQLKETEEKLEKEIRELGQKIPRRQKNLAILEAKDVAKIISQSLGLPVEELIDEEKNRLLDLETEIKKRLIGQDEAVTAVAQALRRARLGLADPQRPLASFLLAGPSGCGKTWLAKILAELIFKDKEAFVRLDMSEFGEGFQASKLIGSPAGYVGYKDANKFTDKIKARPYSVILFDEIDKAHPDIFNLLLQILDEGHLTDATGKKINFKNTVILMTTNLGHEHFSSDPMGFGNGKDFSPDEKNFKSIQNSVLKELKNRFRPEFLNRLDSILVFRPLDLADLEKIADLRINELNKRLAPKNIKIALTSAAVKFLAKKALEFNQGARGLTKALQKEVEEPLTNLLLEKSFDKEQKNVKFELAKNGLSPALAV